MAKSWFVNVGIAGLLTGLLLAFISDDLVSQRRKAICGLFFIPACFMAFTFDAIRAGQLYEGPLIPDSIAPSRQYTPLLFWTIIVVAWGASLLIAALLVYCLLHRA